MPEELPEQFKNAEYRLRTIISNHSGIDSIGLEMNIHLKGTKHTLPTFKPLYTFGKTKRKNIFVCECVRVCVYFHLFVCFGRPWESGVSPNISNIHDFM